MTVLINLLPAYLRFSHPMQDYARHQKDSVTAFNIWTTFRTCLSIDEARTIRKLLTHAPSTPPVDCN